jgi:acetylornithine deacetylase
LDSFQLLERLVAFPSVSDRSNLDIIAFVRDYLAGRGFEVLLVEDSEGKKANLFARLGPADRKGVILSSHSDVVPVAGQAWTSDPFTLIARGERLFGRGTTDMKAFVACSLRAADLASRVKLTAPLYISFSHDEEIGCVGVRSLLDRLAGNPPFVRACIVGEPTLMAIGLGHKGKLAARATFYGAAGHSALAPRFLNAIHLATEFVQGLRRRQDKFASSPAQAEGYDIPYTTVHAGVIGGGTALNLVPEQAFVDFEIRAVGSTDLEDILSAIRADADAIVAPYRARFPKASVAIETVNSYPGFETPESSDAVSFMHRLLEAPAKTKLPFGTEGGLFAQKLGLPVIVCGPGSIAQAHIADEFIERGQIVACDQMMDRLVAELVA